MKQLSIFDTIAQSKILDLIEALNIGRKHKELYSLVLVTDIENTPFKIIKVRNNEGPVYNIVDSYADTPKNFCVNFRIWPLCLLDLEEWAIKKQV
jgi:hypothetical protein